MRDTSPQFEGLGAHLVVVGTGRPKYAREFREELSLDAPVYSDPNMKAYRAAGLRRDLRSTANLKTLAHGARAFRSGFRQSRTKGDPWQQGGVFVIQPDGTVLFEYASKEAGDHPDVGSIVEALKNAAL